MQQRFLADYLAGLASASELAGSEQQAEFLQEVQDYLAEHKQVRRPPGFRVGWGGGVGGRPGSLNCTAAFPCAQLLSCT